MKINYLPNNHTLDMLGGLHKIWDDHAAVRGLQGFSFFAVLTSATYFILL